jgi:hypothetical protein
MAKHGKTAKAKEKWPPEWAELPDLATLQALARGEEVPQPPPPSVREILADSAAGRALRRQSGG